VALVLARPWLDRSGRFSGLRALTFAFILLPAAWIAMQAALDMLGPRPVTEAIHQSGFWAIRFLALTLAITPLRSASRVSKLVGLRRMIGVSVFAYAALHLALYGLDQHFDLPHIVSEIVKRIYLAIGFAGFVILSLLAATSTDAMIKRLGARWAKLHKWVYAVALIGAVHFFLQSKADVSDAVTWGGILSLLLAYRVVLRLNRDPSVFVIAGLGVASAVATALFEAGWYSLAKGAPFTFVLEANLDPTDTVRPAWFVLFAGLAIVAARLLRPYFDAARGPSRGGSSRGDSSRDRGAGRPRPAVAEAG